MKIPQLYDWANPTAPKWSPVEPTREELDSLSEACVMILGYDPRPDAEDRYVVLGSGFLISTLDRLTILTAAHIFTWWTDQIRPPAQHALRGASGDHEDAGARLRFVLEQGYIVAAISLRGVGGGGICCRIEHFSSNVRPADMDIAVVQVSLPTGKGPADFHVLRLDADRFDFREPVLMAGYIGGGRSIALDSDQLFGAAYWEQKFAIRAGKVAEYVSDSTHQHRYMYRVSMPSLPGMSGGPLIVPRPMDGILGVGFEPTAVGVVSSSGFAQPFLLDHCEDGETWVTPIAHALARKVNTTAGLCTLSEAIKNGSIDAAGSAAHRATVSRDPKSGVLSYRLEKD
jgi:hypothetical protein